MTDTEIDGQPAVDEPQRADWGRYGRRPAVLLALVALIDSVDKGILPGVLTEVQDDLGFSDTQMGALAAAFIVAGFLVAIPAGYLADRYQRTRIIAIVLGSWGVVSAVNGLVHAYWQFLAVRVTLGAGETIDNPASSSLLADYYRPEVRGRAFALQRVAPILGGAIGLGLGGLVAATLGWRWAFVIVGGPGSLLALAVWRTPEPGRGESDRADDGGVPLPGAVGTVAELAATQVEASGAAPTDRRAGFEALRRDLLQVIRIRTLRSLMVGTAIGSGALQGIAFWATAFYERHTSLGTGGSAGVVAALIATGALVGTFAAGRLVDSMRTRVIGFPMLMSGVALLAGSALLFVTFLPLPLWLLLPGQTLAVICIVGGLLPLAVMTTEVVPAALRGAAFSLTFFLASLGGALSPLAVGAIADRFPIVVDGDTKGDLAKAFLIVTPLVAIGALVVLRGRRHVVGDVAAAQAAIAAQAPAT